MPNAAAIHERMPVVGSDGHHVGTVDHIENGVRIKLAKSEPDSGGRHHYLPLEWVAAVIDGQVKLKKPGAEAKQSWKESF